MFPVLILQVHHYRHKKQHIQQFSGTFKINLITLQMLETRINLSGLKKGFTDI